MAAGGALTGANLSMAEGVMQRICRPEHHRRKIIRSADLPISLSLSCALKERGSRCLTHLEPSCELMLLNSSDVRCLSVLNSLTLSNPYRPSFLGRYTPLSLESSTLVFNFDKNRFVQSRAGLMGTLETPSGSTRVLHFSRVLPRFHGPFLCRCFLGRRCRLCGFCFRLLYSGPPLLC